MDDAHACPPRDRAEALGAADLELFATSAYMIGRDEDYRGLLERAYGIHVAAGEPLAAFRCAFWIGVTFALQGETGRAGGWLGPRRAVARAPRAGVRRARLPADPRDLRARGGGRLGGGRRHRGRGGAIAERFGDSDLFALAAHEQGHILILDGHLKAGLALLDEAMVAVTAGELSPIVSGIVYCGVILACQDAHEVRRAREWTAALTRWCERQPDLVAFTGRCLVHRAEILQLQGAWAQALDEARRAASAAGRRENAAAAGEALYRQGEIHRLRGDARRGRGGLPRGQPPWPRAAARAWRSCGWRRARPTRPTLRSAGRSPRPPSRGEAGGCCRPASRSCSLSATLTGAARPASELERLRAATRASALGAMAAQARGAVELAAGDADGGAHRARRAARCGSGSTRRTRPPGRGCWWARLPRAGRRGHRGARVGRGPRRVRRAGSRTGPRARRCARGRRLGEFHGLTDRELEVLRLVAAGATNKAIAAELVLSVRTVDRHVSNIFAKLDVSSRAAARPTPTSTASL